MRSLFVCHVFCIVWSVNSVRGQTSIVATNTGNAGIFAVGANNHVSGNSMINTLATASASQDSYVPTRNQRTTISTPRLSTLSPQESVNVCGYSSYALVQGGQAVQNAEFPWLGGLFSTGDHVYMCTVNLVSANHAVTAAHCFPSKDPKTFGIRWGHPRTNRQTHYVGIKDIKIHPGYNQSTLHDVAVITLSEPVNFSLSLKPICLWRSTWSPDKDIIGTVAGFGPNYEDLRKVEIPIVSQETCRASNVFFHFATSEYTFCAGTRNTEEGPCKGDSGAGYMQFVKDRFYLRGLVSHSLSANGNCNLQEYIIFADLSKEVGWVTRIVSS